jgi:hypothetical protein
MKPTSGFVKSLFGATTAVGPFGEVEVLPCLAPSNSEHYISLTLESSVILYVVDRIYVWRADISWWHITHPGQVCREHSAPQHASQNICTAPMRHPGTTQAWSCTQTLF